MNITKRAAPVESNQATIDAGETLWNSLKGQDTENAVITLTETERRNLWAYNDFLHRNGYSGITPQKEFRATFKTVPDVPPEPPAPE